MGGSHVTTLNEVKCKDIYLVGKQAPPLNFDLALLDVFYSRFVRCIRRTAPLYVMCSSLSLLQQSTSRLPLQGPFTRIVMPAFFLFEESITYHIHSPGQM